MTRTLSLGVSTSVGAHVIAAGALVVSPLLSPVDLPASRNAPQQPIGVVPVMVRAEQPRIIDLAHSPQAHGRRSAAPRRDDGRIPTGMPRSGAASTSIDLSGGDWVEDPLGDDADLLGACWPRCFGGADDPASSLGALGPSGDAAPLRAGPDYALREPQQLVRVNPVYPEIARRSRIEGRVVLECVLAPDGVVRNVVVKQGNALLSTAAVEAVRQWRYVPTLLNGRPVSVVLVVSVDFRLVS